MRDSNIGIVNLRLTKGTHWLAYTIANCFDSYGCPAPKKLNTFSRTMEVVFFSGCEVRRIDNYCAAYCLSSICLTNDIKTDFNS